MEKLTMSQHKCKGTYHKPPPVADYNVTTNPELSPDCSCNYFYAGTYNGQPYYRRADGLFFIWWDEEDKQWTINAEVGNIYLPEWVRGDQYDREIMGEYWNQQGTTGHPIVSIGPH